MLRSKSKPLRDDDMAFDQNERPPVNTESLMKPTQHSNDVSGMMSSTIEKTD